MFHNRQNKPQKVVYKKGTVKNFAELAGKYLCWSLFFNKVSGLWPITLFKERLRHRCLPVNFANLK